MPSKWDPVFEKLRAGETVDISEYQKGYSNDQNMFAALKQRAAKRGLRLQIWYDWEGNPKVKSSMNARV